MKKVVQFHGVSGYGGSCQHTLLLSKGINRQKDFDINVILFNNDYLNTELIKDNIKTHILHRKTKYDFKCLTGLIKYIKSISPNIMHSHLRNADYYGQIGAFLIDKRIKRIVTIHDYINIDDKGIKTENLSSKIYTIVLKKFTDKIIVLSKRLKYSLIDEYKIDEHKIQIIHNGIDTDKFKPVSYSEKQYMRNKLNISEKDTIILVPGRITYKKGHTFFIKNISDYIKDKPNIKIIILGDGILLNDVIDTAKDLGVYDKILFKNPTDNPENYYNISDVLINPSFREGFGRTTLEAMACGVPVLASRVGAQDEIIEHKKDGIIFENQDGADMLNGLIELIENKNLYNKIKSNCRKKIEDKFSMELFISKHIELYNNLYR